MKTYNVYNFRLYPTDEQKAKLNSFLGTTRFLYIKIILTNIFIL